MQTRHTVPVTDDESVVAVHHHASSNDWLVFCHGLLSDKSGSYEGRCERAVAEGYNAVRFDFRGCGESDGAFVDHPLSSRIADLGAVLDYFDAESYTLFGSSFGGKTAFHTAVRDERVTAIAARAPVTYNRAHEEARAAVDRDGQYRYDTGHVLTPDFFDDLDRYPFSMVVDSVHLPVALFHGTADDTVALADSLDATGAFETDVFLQTFHGEDHRFSEAAETRMRHRLFAWLAAV